MEKTILKLTIARVLTASVMIASPLAAVAAFQLGDTVGTDEASIRAQLEAQGYEVEEIETEDGYISVEFQKGSVEMELEIDLATGQVLAIESDDEDEGSEDDDHDDDNDDNGKDDHKS